MSNLRDRDEVISLLSQLEPVLLRRVILASRLSPETLPDEIMLLESTTVLGRELGPARRR